MKNYIAVPRTIKTSKTYGFSTIDMKVFVIKNNELHYIGRVEFTSNNTKGFEGEVMDLLLHEKLITPRQWNYSVSPCVGRGYYAPDWVEKKDGSGKYIQTCGVKDESKWFAIKVIQ